MSIRGQIAVEMAQIINKNISKIHKEILDKYYKCLKLAFSKLYYVSSHIYGANVFIFVYSIIFCLEGGSIFYILENNLLMLTPSLNNS